MEIPKGRKRNELISSMKRAIAYSLPILLVAFGAAAQTSVESNAVQDIREGIRQKLQNIQEVKQEVRQDVKQATTEANQKIQVLRKETVEQFQKQREEAGRRTHLYHPQRHQRAHDGSFPERS